MLPDERKGIKIFLTWPVVVASACLWSEMCDKRLSNWRSVKREINISEEADHVSSHSNSNTNANFVHCSALCTVIECPTDEFPWLSYKNRRLYHWLYHMRMWYGFIHLLNLLICLTVLLQLLGRMRCEWLIKKDVTESGCSIFYSTVLVFTWRDFEKIQKPNWR
jgi:hypothetical protein